MAPPPQFKLSRSLSGHSSDVRAVCSPTDNLILSASRDGTVRSWNIPEKPVVNPLFANVAPAQPENIDVSVFSQHSGYVNSLAYHPEGYVVSGGQDKLIYVHKPGDTQPSHVLVGHENNVCALDVGIDGTVISGSWDNTARVWKNWECVYTLKGHERAVWAVLALQNDQFLTASADKTIRLWEGNKLVRTFSKHTDVVRGLCEIPGLGFASCGNDAVIYVWTRDGEQVLELHGHTTFIYSLSVLPTGEIVSSGEDRSVKIWNHGECIQTITLPAISVWSVSVQPNGDIVCGASDSEVRVFTRDKTRFASQQDIAEFDAKVSSSVIPQESLGDINKEKLPGPSALKNKGPSTTPMGLKLMVGKKDGQVIMVKNGASVEAHQWSSATESWTKIGDVVNAVSQSQKQIYEGIEYDYVFDVDIQEGAPALKLPYNVSQNPYEAAQKFLEKNGLEMGYLDQVAKFIEQNTGGVKLGTGGGAVDPYSSSRYIPGTSSGYEQPYQPSTTDPYTAHTAATPTSRKHLPQKTYLSFKVGELGVIINKMNTFNTEVPPNHAVSAETLSQVAALKAQISPQTIQPLLPVLAEVILSWPPPKRFPAIDILRLAASKAHADVIQFKVGEHNIIDVLVEGAELKEDVMQGRKELDVNALLVLRTFVNLFDGEQGRAVMTKEYEKVLDSAKIGVARSNSKPLKVAFSTLLLNYAVLFLEKNDSDNAIVLLDPLVKAIQDTTADAEAIFRGLVALGTALSIPNDEIKVAAKQVFGLKEALEVVKKSTKENRVKEVISEIAALLS